MMEVTKSNFREVLPEVLAAVERCSFIAFDCEFSGLLHGVRERLMDEPQERYHKLKQGSADFCVVQFGLCLFTAEEACRYSAVPFNFYLFHSTPHRKLDHTFRCLASSLVFLSKHKMDFNKWISEGIPYLSEEEQRWWEGRREGGREDGEGEEMEHFVGFSEVIKAISTSGKPLVGHNCILDLMHCHTHFTGPLPKTLVQFKREVLRRFPCIYDTKVVAENSILQPHIHTHSLDALYCTVSKKPFPPLTIDLPPHSLHYATAPSSHEAAYDAYITGYSLVAMAAHLRGKTKPGASDGDGAGACSDGVLCSALEREKNKVYVQYCDGYRCFFLGGTESPVCRDNVLHATFPKQTSFDDLKNLFSPFGKVKVDWINDTSAFVILSKRSAKECLSHGAVASQADEMSYSLLPYSDWSSRQCSHEPEDHPAPAKRPRHETSAGPAPSGTPNSEAARPEVASHPDQQLFEESSEW